MSAKINKEQWVEMFEEIGLSESQMKQWHQVFEFRHPAAHESFLEWIGIAAPERVQIRAGVNES